MSAQNKHIFQVQLASKLKPCKQCSESINKGDIEIWVFAQRQVFHMKCYNHKERMQIYQHQYLVQLHLYKNKEKLQQFENWKNEYNSQVQQQVKLNNKKEKKEACEQCKEVVSGYSVYYGKLICNSCRFSEAFSLVSLDQKIFLKDQSEIANKMRSKFGLECTKIMLEEEINRERQLLKYKVIIDQAEVFNKLEQNEQIIFKQLDVSIMSKFQNNYGTLYSPEQLACDSRAMEKIYFACKIDKQNSISEVEANLTEQRKIHFDSKIYNFKELSNLFKTLFVHVMTGTNISQIQSVNNQRLKLLRSREAFEENVKGYQEIQIQVKKIKINKENFGIEQSQQQQYEDQKDQILVIDQFVISTEKKPKENENKVEVFQI